MRTPPEFQAVLRGLRVGKSPHFDMFERPNGAASARLGLAMSRKSAPLAVTRNLAKRIARESARAANGLQRLAGFDIVLRGRPGLGPDWSRAKREKSLTQFRHALRAEIDALFDAAARRPEGPPPELRSSPVSR